MRRFPKWVVRIVLSLTGLLWLAPVTAGATSIALLPLQDRTGDRQAIAAVDQHLMSKLLNLGGIVNPGEVRDSLRQLRVRRVDTVSPDILRRVGRGVQADWLISVTLHEANSEDVPRLTLSARAYLTETGELFWAGFQSGSGLGPRTVLGLKEIRTVDSLAGWVVTRLFEDLEKGSQDLESKGHSRETAQAQKLGRVAVVPIGWTDPEIGEQPTPKP